MRQRIGVTPSRSRQPSGLLGRLSVVLEADPRQPAPKGCHHEESQSVYSSMFSPDSHRREPRIGAAILVDSVLGIGELAPAVVTCQWGGGRWDLSDGDRAFHAHAFIWSTEVQDDTFLRHGLLEGA